MDISASPDGAYLTSIGFDGSLKIWDAKHLHSEQEGRTVHEGGPCFFWTSFSPDGKRIAVGYISQCYSAGVVISDNGVSGFVGRLICTVDESGYAVSIHFLQWQWLAWAPKRPQVQATC